MKSDVPAINWVVAKSNHSDSGREIFWRFAENLTEVLDRESLPYRITVVWRYEAATSLPTSHDSERMVLLEELLEPLAESKDKAALAIVCTGEGLREWTYYSASGDEFISDLNSALSASYSFPIEIYVDSDPAWNTYNDVMGSLRSSSSCDAEQA